MAKRFKVESTVRCPSCGYEEGVTEIWNYRDRQYTDYWVEIQGKSFWGRRGDPARCPRCGFEFEL